MIFTKKVVSFQKKSVLNLARCAYYLWSQSSRFHRWLGSVKVSFFHRVVLLRTAFRAFYFWNEHVSTQALLRSVMVSRRIVVNKSNKMREMVWRRTASAFVSCFFANWSSLVKNRHRFDLFLQLAEHRSSQHIASNHFLAWHIVRLRAKSASSPRAELSDVNTQVLHQSTFLFVVFRRVFTNFNRCLLPPSE